MTAEENRTVHQAAKGVHEMPIKPEERDELLAEVARGFQGDVSITVTSSGRTGQYGHQSSPYGFRSPMDTSTPGRQANPVREGVSFTPSQTRGGQPIVVMDYQFRDGAGDLIACRLPMNEQTAYRVLAGSVQDPQIPRDIANNLMDTRARSVGSELTQATFTNNDIGQTQIFDGITTGVPLAEAAQTTGSSLFPPAETYIQYPARNFDGMYQ